LFDFTLHQLITLPTCFAILELSCSMANSAAEADGRSMMLAIIAAIATIIAIVLDSNLLATLLDY